MVKTRNLTFFGVVGALAMAGSSAIVRANKNKAEVRVETRLVQVNVVARDSHGLAVRNLTKSDFRLYDNGKEVPIDIFSALSITPAAPKPLPPNVYSNRVQGAAPSATVVLLDGLNTTFADQTWARTEVVKFLQAIKPQDRVAIMLLSSRLFVLQNFTSNPKILLAALQDAKTASRKEVEASAAPTPPGVTDKAAYNLNGDKGTYAGASPQQYQSAVQKVADAAASGVGGEAADVSQLEQTMLEFSQFEREWFLVDRVQRTSDAITAIANYLAQFPGRKNLIWVSSSFPIDFGFETAVGQAEYAIHFTPELERAYQALNNADLAVYPVDARGLTAAAPGAVDWNSFYKTQGTMREVARNTGGQAFMNSNDLARVMQAAVDDSDGDYTIGFYPQNIRWDGKYHDIKVTVDRPGVQLRYRRGYLATRKAPGNATSSDAALNQAIFNPLDSTGLGLTVKVLNFVHVPQGRVLLGIDVDTRDTALRDAAGRRTVDLAVVLAQLDDEDFAVDTDSYNMKLQVAAGGVPHFTKDGFMVAKWVDLVKGTRTLALVVRDPATGRIGSVRIPLGNW